MLDYLINLVSRLGHWGYWVIFLGAMLESAAFIGVFVPGESLVLVAGFFAAQGVFDLDALIWVITIGATLGDSIGYEIGKRMGRPALARYGSRFGLTASRIEKADTFFARHGGKAVFLGRFVGFARALVPFIAGSSEMRYRQFLPYNMLGAALWSIAVTLLGYFLGASWGVAEKWIGRASAILAAVLIFAMLLYLAWRWTTRHEDTIRQCWLRLISHPKVVSFRARYSPQIAFVQARLSPESYLGLRLTVGVCLLVGASWLFGGIAEDVIDRDPLTRVDAYIAQWLHDHGAPLITQIMLVITHLHGTIAMSIWVMLVAIYLIHKREWHWLIALILTVPCGMLVNVMMKHAFQRARPSLDHPILTLTSYSFPSGHTAASTLLYGFLTMLIISKESSWRLRIWVIFGAFTLVVLVAFSRMYLGAHYLSDVLAAMVEGVAWLAFCLTTLHTFWQHRIEKHSCTNK